MLGSSRNFGRQIVLTEQLGFGEIAPSWSKRLAVLPVPFLTKMRWSMDIHNSDICIVGEAYGYDSQYVNNCDTCKEFSLDFESHFVKNRFDELNSVKERFVEHWNNHHKYVTYSLAGRRRDLKWYDSFLRFDDHIWTTK